MLPDFKQMALALLSLFFFFFPLQAHTQLLQTVLCRLDLLSRVQACSKTGLCLLPTAPGRCRLGFTASSWLQLIPGKGFAKFQVPNSWAVVKAACKPSSSMIEQLRFRSQTVPTSAIPRVSHVLAPHRSCKKRQFHY